MTAAYIDMNYNRKGATLTHIMTANTFWFTKWVKLTQDRYGDCKYDFDFGENTVLTSYWVGLYETDQPQNPTYTKYVTTAIVVDLNYEHIYMLGFSNDTAFSLPFGALKNQGINFRYSYSEDDVYLVPPMYSQDPTLLQYADKLDKRFGRFNQRIKQNTALFNKLKEAADVPDSNSSLRFAAGVGFIDSIGFKDAYEEYGIDKTRPIFYIVTHHKSDYEWTFCYNYADIDVFDTVYCLSSTTGISEPSQLLSSQAYPNPTSGSTTLSLELETACNVKIVLSDVLGQELIEVYDGFATEGLFTKKINTEKFARGVYFLKILIDGNFTVEKIIVN
jgi:hypothetical protein